MGDYAFFGQTWRWPPSEVDGLRWSQRKILRQAYQDHLVNAKSKK